MHLEHALRPRGEGTRTAVLLKTMPSILWFLSMTGGGEPFLAHQIESVIDGVSGEQVMDFGHTSPRAMIPSLL